MGERQVRCFLVSGRVQGVFYRASTRDQAKRLGLDGRAVNLPSGQVEVIAAGEEAALRKLEAWLWEGPSHAQVESVETEESDETPARGFHIG